MILLLFPCRKTLVLRFSLAPNEGRNNWCRSRLRDFDFETFPDFFILRDQKTSGATPLYIDENLICATYTQIKGCKHNSLIRRKPSVNSRPYFLLLLILCSQKASADERKNCSFSFVRYCFEFDFYIRMWAEA